MTNNDILEIKKIKGLDILENEKLSKYTTYKVGGIAKLIVYVHNVDALIVLLKYLRNNDILHMVLGNGSNVLFSDDIYDGVIIKLDKLNNVEFRNNSVRAECGASLTRVSNMALKKGFSNLEFAIGIPGTIGGAVYMNAGAYKSDMGYVVKKVKVLTDDFKIITMVNKELDFHYRTSFFKKNKNYICLEADIALKKGDKKEMEELVKDRMLRRMESQPLEYPSAGSVFRNPENMFAGKLIEDLGFKSLLKGGAQISEKHANFIINRNNAKASDIKELIEFIQERVLEKYNVKLHLEQELINWK